MGIVAIGGSIVLKLEVVPHTTFFGLLDEPVNLAPADVRKAGSSFDLPIALGLLATSGSLTRRCVDDTVIVGELSLDGAINGIRGVLPIAVGARRLGLKRLLLPPQNATEASVVEGLDICVAQSLAEAVEALNEPERAKRATTGPVSTGSTTAADSDLARIAEELSAGGEAALEAMKARLRAEHIEAA